MKTCNECLYQPICNTYASFGVTDLLASDISPCELFKNKADFVEVVRCKKCTHKVDFKGRVMCNRNARKVGEEWWGLTATDNEHFCSYGEKRE